MWLISSRSKRTQSPTIRSSPRGREVISGGISTLSRWRSWRTSRPSRCRRSGDIGTADRLSRRRQRKRPAAVPGGILRAPIPASWWRRCRLPRSPLKTNHSRIPRRVDSIPHRRQPGGPCEQWPPSRRGGCRTSPTRARDRGDPSFCCGAGARFSAAFEAGRPRCRKRMR